MSNRNLTGTNTLSPDNLYGELFRQVQLKHIFSDTKTFVDTVPKIPPEEILKLYEEKKNLPDFDLSKFVNEYFNLPGAPAKHFTSDINVSTVDHINRLWPILTRPADEPAPGSSRIPLPFPYVVPGGRFREIFYWDSYFTMLGLSVSTNTLPLAHSMIDNFAYLIDTYGYIPNGNRTYFLSRSQPPFFACMVHLLGSLDENPSKFYKKYLNQLHAEYQFWMLGKEELTEKNIYNKHVVRLTNGLILNRYWDPKTTPRAESFPKEVGECENAEKMFGITSETFYSHNRAACESGWDFSSRWFADGKTKESNRAAELVPVDLNCLIYFLEHLLSQIYAEQKNTELAEEFEKLSNLRKQTIRTLFWSDEKKFFMDFDPVNNCTTSVLSLAAVYPLFFNIATKEQAEYVQQRLRNDFLQIGGLQTTLHKTGQQWDSPNGWAPLQYMAYQGLKNYQFDELANEIRSRWLNLNDQIFKETGKMTEKYNVVELIEGGGGNYPLQDGFGWTNGVYLKLLHG